MSFTLFDALVPPCQLRLDVGLKLVEKANRFCRDNGIAPDELIQARLADDMHSFAYQIKSLAVHSRGAVEGVRAGVFQPDRSVPPATFAQMTTLLTETSLWLSGLSRSDIEELTEAPVKFEGGRSFADFTGAGFLMSFSLPNLYFHATTAYDILRWKGLPLGKLDFLGALPFTPYPKSP